MIDGLNNKEEAAMNDKRRNLIWIDLEMTGLDCQQDSILEIATIITDSDLTILAEGPSLAIFQPPEVLAKMNDWVRNQHQKSGLTERVQNSRISLQEAEALTLDFVKLYTDAKESPMCGNTICQDRRFMANHMKALEAHFHYRHLDVSTVKELAKRWAPKLYEGFTKSSKHLALDDIIESIEELKYYRERFFNLDLKLG